jgi:hypothetical protein
MTVAKRFGHSRALWFILTLIFPFILVLIAVRPPKVSITPHEKKRIIVVTARILLIATFLVIVGLWPSDEDVFYLVGARWINTDNAVFGVFKFFLALIGLALIPYGILVALGIVNADR